MKQIIQITLFLCIASIIGCEESSPPCPDCSPPPPFRMSIKSKSDSADLIYDATYSTDSIQILYSEGSTIKYVEIEIELDSISESSIIRSSEIQWISDAGINDFFLYLNQFDTDTMYLDIESYIKHCCAFYRYNSFFINGYNMFSDSTNLVFTLWK